MYKVSFYTFNKRLNSTLRPTTQPVVYDCKIMDPAGILAPVVDLKLPDTGNPSGLNYAYIDAWQRYYYVRDWVYISGIWRAQLQVDVLASWRDQIGAQTAYIARSSAAFNGRVGDSTYPILAGNTMQTTVGPNPFTNDFANGWYIVGIINSDQSAIGGISYYGMRSAEFQVFRNLMFGNLDWAGTITDVETSVVKMLANPFQYIASVMWFPFAPASYTTVDRITFGYWSVSCTAHRLTNITVGGTAYVTVPKHPLAANRGYYLLCEPYSSYYMDFPPFGAFTVPAEMLVDSNQISMNWACDLITGRGRLMLYNDSNNLINVVEGQIGISVQIASAAPDVGGLVNQLLDRAAGKEINPNAAATIKPRLMASAAGNALDDIMESAGLPSIHSGTSYGSEPAPNTGVFDGIKTFVSNVTSAIMQHYYPMQTVGNNSGYLNYTYSLRLIGTFARIADEDNQDRGRPLCEFRQINTIPGFIQVADAHLTVPATLSEQEEINITAAAGFFWE